MQKLHSSFHWLIKAPPPFASDMFTYQTATALLTCCKVHVTRLFLSFPADCCIHFLTLVSNSVTISQRTFHGIIMPFQIHRGDSFLLFLFRGFYESAAKLQSLNHISKII